VNRFGYTDNEITIISKYSTNLSEDDRVIVDHLYKINVLIHSVKRLLIMQAPEAGFSVLELAIELFTN
jgi:hypothetical protein